MIWPRDDAKLESVRALMVEHDLDALVVRAPDNVLYLSNYWGMKGYEVVVFPQEGVPTLIALEPSQADAERTAWTENMLFFAGYDESLAHWIEGASDVFLMPSLYEPCGLNQMYSLRYGTVPIVRRTGGLADSVVHFDPVTGVGTGIVFNDFDTAAVDWALDTALAWYREPALWERLMRNGMRSDFSWEAQARKYLELFAGLLAVDPSVVVARAKAPRRA